MRLLRVLTLRLKSLFLREKVEDELRKEWEDHLASETESNLRAGMTPSEARYAAQRALGSLSLYGEQCRDERRIRWWDAFWRDLRYARRVLGKDPLFAALAIGTLGLGIGANTALYSLVQKMLLSPLPAAQPEQLVSVNNGGGVNFSYPAYRDIRDRNRVFSGLAALRFNPIDLSAGGERNFRVWGYEVTSNYFDLLGVQPLVGRFFHSTDGGQPGSDPAIVLSYDCWQARFAGDPRIAGKHVKVNSFGFTVIGVARPAFTGTERIVAADYWIPMSMEAQVEPGNNWLDNRFAGMVWLLGRLKPGATRAEAESSLQMVAQREAHDYPASSGGMRLSLSEPGLIGNMFRGPVRLFATIIMAIAGAVLLLACINLAGLQLARASDRRKEIALRLALGAGRAQLVRQLLSESVLLAVGGLAAGCAFAWAILRALAAWHPPIDLPIDLHFPLDQNVLLFACLLAAVTALLCGLAPALQSTGMELVGALKQEPAHERLRHLTLRDLLAIAQIAVSLFLLIASALVITSLKQALHVQLGFDPRHAVSISFDLALQGYREEQGRAFRQKVLGEAQSLPGLQAAGIIDYPPLRIGENEEPVSLPGGVPEDRRTPNTAAHLYRISPGYLAAAGTQLLSGRDFSVHDDAHAPHVALVNQHFVQHFFPRTDPLGKQFRLGPTERSPLITIAGVVEDGKYSSLGEEPGYAVFQPLAQAYMGWTTIVARTKLPSRQAVAELRSLVHRLDPDMPVFNAGSLAENLAWPLLPARIAALILTVFGALAALLAAIGIFALVRYAVSRRSREIGIRVALGARPGQVLRFVLHRTFLLCAAGAVLGTALAWASAHILAAILFGVSAHDPVTYACAFSAMALVAALAGWLPARRALRIDPARTLRDE